MPDLTVDCPAGVQIGDLQARPLGCRCRIEQHTLLEPEQTPSLVRWCYGDYTQCPTWRADKEAVWAGQGDAITASDEANRKRWDFAQAERARQRLEAFQAGEDHVAEWNPNKG